MSSSLTLFERQPQSIAVCYLFLLSPSQNTPSCYFVSSALTLKALKGKTAEGEKATIVSIIKAEDVAQIPLIKGG